MKLLDMLQENGLLGINDLSFIKKILELINKSFLLTEVNNYENQLVKVVDAKPRRQISGN
jgi:hypothetical protein